MAAAAVTYRMGSSFRSLSSAFQSPFSVNHDRCPHACARGGGAPLMALAARCELRGGARQQSRFNNCGEGPRFTLAPRFLVRARVAPRPAVSIRRRRRAAMGTVRREPIETAGRGVAVACVRSGISGWVIGLLIRGRAVAERRAANSWSPWSPMLADGEARRCFLFGTWRSAVSAVAELFANRRSQQLAAGQPSDVLALCWIWNRPSATAP